SEEGAGSSSIILVVDSVILGIGAGSGLAASGFKSGCVVASVRPVGRGFVFAHNPWKRAKTIMMRPNIRRKTPTVPKSSRLNSRRPAMDTIAPRKKNKTPAVISFTARNVISWSDFEGLKDTGGKRRLATRAATGSNSMPQARQYFCSFRI